MGELAILAIKLSLPVYVFCALGEPDMIFAPYQRQISKLPDWLYNPLGGCHKCLTGQVFLWYYLIEVRPYSFINHVFFISLGIFLSIIYNFIWTRLNQ
jgi:hypothetical protein